MAQQIDLSGDGGVLKQIVAEGAGPQVCAIPPSPDSSMSACAVGSIRECPFGTSQTPFHAGAWCGSL